MKKSAKIKTKPTMKVKDLKAKKNPKGGTNFAVLLGGGNVTQPPHP